MQPKKKLRGVGKITYPVRILGYYAGAGIVFTDHWQYNNFDFGSVTFILFALSYPHAVLQVYKYFDCDSRIELRFLLFDTFMVGVVINLLSFALVPSLVLFTSINSNNISMRGASQFWVGLLCMGIGMLFAGFFNGYEYRPETSSEVLWFSAFFLVVYTFYTAYVNYQNGDGLKTAKIAMAQQNKVLLELNEKIERQTEVLQENNEELRASEEELRQGTEELQAINEQLGETNLQLSHREKELEAQAVSLDKAYQQITSSINYARRIQQAMLPKIEEIQRFLPESFVLFRPRDMVSGDFYWFQKIEMKPIYEDIRDFEGIKKVFKGFANEKIVIAANDCTGHGVPGAFMSVLGNNLLNEIVNLREIVNADLIMNELHKGIRRVLRQDENKSHDGMDMTLCVIDLEDRTVEFAGAHSPLFYVQDQEMHSIKSDKFSVGGYTGDDDQQFSSHSISIKKPTVLYLFSDGFQDQFGGKDGRKFMIKQLRELLLDIHREPMPVQKEILEKTLINWMEEGGQKQVDDVLVIGIRI